MNVMMLNHMSIIVYAVHHKTFCIKCLVTCSEMAVAALLIVRSCLLMLSGFSEGRDLSQAVY